MKNAIQFVDTIFQRAVGTLCALLIVVMIVAVGGQVVMRYAFNAPLVWSEELARYSMIWLAMLACGLCARLGQHIALTDLLPFKPRTRMIVAAFSTVFTIVVVAVLLWYSWELAARVSRQTSSSLGVSMSYIYAAIPVGSLLMIVGMVLGLIAEFCGARSPAVDSVETLQAAG